MRVWRRTGDEMGGLRRPSGKGSGFGVDLLVCWLALGLAFHLLYHGVPHPLRFWSWAWIAGWPIFVVAGMIRWFFMLPFATVAFAGFLLVFLARSRRGAR